MNRLTRRNRDDIRAYCPSHVKCEGKCSECEYMDKMMEKLAEYEDLEEQGLILRLPCKVGTQVWKIKECSGGGRIPNWHEIYNANFALELLSDFGKTVFLTKEEAEQALKQIGV